MTCRTSRNPVGVSPVVTRWFLFPCLSWQHHRAVRGGRRGKGPRRYFGLRLAEPLADELIRRADAAGLTINDYAASALAEALGLELPADVDPAQQVLPIAG